MNITIIGGGAIGLLSASYLKKQGHCIRLVVRTKKQELEIKENGILKEKQGEIDTVSVDVHSFKDFSIDKEELIIVAVKQTNVNWLIDWLNKMIRSHVPVLFLQNGMGHLQRAEKILPNEIIAGVVTHGAVRSSLNRVVHTGVGDIKIGGDASIERMLHKLECEDPDFLLSWTPDIDIIIRKKLLVNAVVNPLTAIYNVKNGELLKRDTLFTEAWQVFQEASLLLDLPFGEWEHVQDIIKKTSENRSSMLMDILNKKETEIEAMTGYLLALSEKRGILATKLMDIHLKVKEMEKGRKDE